MDEGDTRFEEEMKKFRERMEQRYGSTTEDIIKRLDTLNHELEQVISTVESVEDNMVTKEAFELEMKNLTSKTDGINKRIDDWRDSTKTYFMVMGGVIAVVGIIIPAAIFLLTWRIAA